MLFQLFFFIPVSNGKLGYTTGAGAGQFIEDFHSQISSGRATERALLQQGIMGLVGSPLHNEYVFFINFSFNH